MKMSEVDGSERINEKIHEYRGSSSDSDDEKPLFHNSRKKWLFGRKESVHALLGGGKCMFCLQFMVYLDLHYHFYSV